MSQKYQKLKELLKTLFQLDQPDLDFGLYRIMHAKSGEISKFLDEDLLPQVKQAFSRYQPADKAELQKELDQAIEQARSLGVPDADSLPAVQKLRTRIANEAVDLSALEGEVYDHLYSFFRRYYDEGDFLSKRVYKPGVYAIPYEGEETKFTWANQDQYYIKTSEYLRDYAFRLHPGNEANPMRVHFRLVDAAEGEHGNLKAAEGKDRAFILAPAGESGWDFIHLVPGENGQLAELQIDFEYRPPVLTDWPEAQRDGKKKPPAQNDLLAIAVVRINAVEAAELLPWLAELLKPHLRQGGGQADYSRLAAHLDAYTKHNTFDYFIHKDLGAFLRRELDFYIKNEIMHIDDLENESVSRVEQYLSKIKVVRAIARKIIDFLAQLEDFQKKLWLKKKFVVETNYCITLDRIPEEFYPEIIANDSQREEWVALLAINEGSPALGRATYTDPLSIEFLREESSLMVDTSLFSEDFKNRLLDSLDINRLPFDGIVINSDNFHALRLAVNSWKGAIDCVYIDPPYNTDASPIIYKNGYQQSSWASLMNDRMTIDLILRKDPSLRCIAIDDFEYPQLQEILAQLSSEVHHATVSVRSKPQGRPTAAGFSSNHEYATFWGPKNAIIGRLPRVGSKAERYPHQDEQGIYSWANFRKSGTDSNRTDRRRSYYPVFVSDGTVRIPKMAWNEAEENWEILEEPGSNEVAVRPIDEEGNEKVWTCSPERAVRELEDFRVEASSSRTEVYKKYRPNQDGALPGTWWDNPAYSASESGTKVLKDLFGIASFDFDYPKSINLVADCLRVCSLGTRGIVLDYFAGSGTTAHAVAILNREDARSRRFFLVEAGSHFDSVLIPRLKKITYTPDWSGGKPSRTPSSEEINRGPHLIKIVRLESYEDALNNLDIRRSEQQQNLLTLPDVRGEGGFREQYLLKYMLDVETRGSQSLLNVKSFADPTAYKLLVKRPGTDESRETNVDLLETLNWLIGLRVKHIAAPQSFTAEFERDGESRLTIKGRLKLDTNGPWWFRKVEGTTPDGRNALIVWRKLTGDSEQDNLVLDTWMKDRLKISTRDFEFDVIYVNGDNNLENLKLANDTWKVRLIEEDFHRLMFDTEGL